jgi:D-3-phosphoglycerate dehydrogenase
MKNNDATIFLLDFDSTFIKSEGLDALATLSLQNHPQKEVIIGQILELTRLGMNGKLTFSESLQKRIALLESNKTDIKKLGKLLKQNISESILRNKPFFKKHKEHIYIISGGFKELIIPVVKQFGIKPEHIFANTFMYDSTGNVKGIDPTNLMSQNNGKANVVKSLGLQNDLYIIGDGYTDYELRKYGLVKKFIAFTENIEREIVVRHADEIAPTFDEFLFVNNLPQTISYPKNRISVLIVGKLPSDDVKRLEKEGYQLKFVPLSIHDEELKNKMQDCSIVFLPNEKTITADLLQNTKRLLAIGIDKKPTAFIDPGVAQKGIVVFGGKDATKRIINYINSGSTHLAINFPSLHLPNHGNVHRLLHLHKNVPGILAQINTALAQHEINIIGQYLKTLPNLGYVIIDVDKAYDKKILKVLKKIPNTIRFRILY